MIDPAAISKYLADTFSGFAELVANGDSYFYYDPPGTTEPDRRFPFATLVTSDAHDQFSDLNRDGVFRLNVGVSKETFRSLFGDQEIVASDYDFTAFDRILPHPVYGMMYWVCVLNPGDATWPQVQTLLAEAYQKAIAKN